MGKCKESILIYGVSGVGKTTQGQEFAAAVKRSTGKKTRLISCTGGGWTSILPVVELGLVEPLFVPDRNFPVETIDKLSRGFWPQYPEDANSPLLPPEQQRDWDDVGGLMFDSLTEMCSWMMNGTVTREAAGLIKISAQPIRFQDGATNFGTPSLAHYGVFQSRIEQCVSNSKALTGRYIMWTALELKASDDNTRLPVYGPDIIGKAKTASACAWFDNTLHLMEARTGGAKRGESERRLYFNTHFEDDGVPYIAKNRGHLYAPLSKFTGGLHYLSGEKLSVDLFLQLLDRSQAEAKEILKKKLNTNP